MSKKSEALMATLLGSNKEMVSVIHSAFDETPRVVAMVEVNKSASFIKKCEVAFVKTNTINDAWWRNEGVTPMFPENGCRSTSVGDMVLIGTEKYKCDPMGWSLI
jgi:hypothetical protein|tara:strand:- start:349 stop:663 length:315 start_codon:yes stop_codon:yes gene_type:complete